MIREAIQLLVDRGDLSFDQAQQSMQEIMTGEATPAQIGAFLTALRLKGETIDEITAFATVMRKHSVRINPRVDGRTVDTCGTGGDRVKTFNVSTAAALAAAGAGVTIAKHGNRSVTSKCGSADVLETVGVDLNASPETVEKCIEQIGIGFMFAPTFHPAMKNAITPRRDIGIRTIFNILGPLTNPANANAQLLGVYGPNLVETVARVLLKLGVEEAMVVHGLDGLDEISIIGKTKFAWLKNGQVTTQEITPRDLNLKLARPEEIAGSDVQQSAKFFVQILKGSEKSDSPRLQMVLANAAAAVLLGGKASDLPAGLEIARESIDSGRAYEKLKQLIRYSNGDETKLERLEAENA